MVTFNDFCRIDSKHINNLNSYNLIVEYNEYVSSIWSRIPNGISSYAHAIIQLNSQYVLVANSA